MIIRGIGRFLGPSRRTSATALVGIAIVVAYFLVAVFAPNIAPYSETQIVGGKLEPWSAAFLLGTDNLGRDVLSRLLFGARNTLGITFLVTCLAFLLGGFLGLIAAVLGGWADNVMSRLNDVLLSIPPLIFALLFLTVLGNSMPILIVVMTVAEATRVYRVARAVGQTVVAFDFVEAARLRGERTWWIVRKEVLPNVIPPLATEFGIRFCYILLLISSLAFLGLGLQPPAAMWGSMVRDNAILITFGDPTPLVPALAIVILAIGINFAVDAIIEARTSLD